MEIIAKDEYTKATTGDHHRLAVVQRHEDGFASIAIQVVDGDGVATAVDHNMTPDRFKRLLAVFGLGADSASKQKRIDELEMRVMQLERIAKDEYAEYTRVYKAQRDRIEKFEAESKRVVELLAEARIRANDAQEELELAADPSAQIAAAREEGFTRGQREGFEQEREKSRTLVTNLRGQLRESEGDCAAWRAGAREASQRLRAISGAYNGGPKSLLDYVADVEAFIVREELYNTTEPAVGTGATLEAERDEARALAEEWRQHHGGRLGECNRFPWEPKPERPEPWGVKLHRLLSAIPSVQFVMMTQSENPDVVRIKTACHVDDTTEVRKLVEQHVPDNLGWSLEFTS